MLTGPISVALLGYLWAMGEASAVLKATLVGIPLMAAVALPLLPVIGATAVGVGWLASGTAEVTVLIRSARKHCDFRVVPGLAPPAACATVAATLGWIVVEQRHATAWAGLVGGLFAVVLYVFLLAVVHRSELLDTARLAAHGLRGILKDASTSNA